MKLGSHLSGAVSVPPVSVRLPPAFSGLSTSPLRRLDLRPVTYESLTYLPLHSAPVSNSARSRLRQGVPSVSVPEGNRECSSNPALSIPLFTEPTMCDAYRSVRH